MEIQHDTVGDKGRFFHEKDNRTLAEMTYSKAGEGVLIIDHTHVEDELRGQGAGMQLLNALVEYARSNQQKVLPLCPFAAAMFKKTAEIQDVLKK